MGVAEDLPGFGVELTKLSFKDNLDWLVSLRDPRELFLAQPTYVISEYLYYAIAFLTLVHSLVVGGRWKYLWLGALVHGVTTEMISFLVPHIDSYWHSQTSVMLVGRRLPLHITLLYPVLMYNAAYLVSHMKLPKCTQPIAAGLAEVLLDIPYDIMAVKFVHWTWHDTDPSIYDRSYWVPWTSYYFHLTFGISFHVFLNFWRRKITGTDDEGKPSSFIREITCAILAGLSGMPGGILQFVVLYHPLHDYLGVHAENCWVLMVVLCLLIVWGADRSPTLGSRRQQNDSTHWSVWLIILGLISHYGLYLGMALFGTPENEVSIGLHQTTGVCDHYTDVNTAFGLTLKKQTFLCLKDYDEKYFDFHCLKSPPKNGAMWYTICGTKFDNRPEYISAISGICIVALFIYYNLLFKSSATIRHKSKKVVEKKKKN